MENKWVLRAALVLAVCFTIHLTSGKATRTSNKTTSEKLAGFRNESVKVGNNVTLLCNNEKISWDKMIYVIWKFFSEEKNCIVSVAPNDPDLDTCEDGKKINISESGDYSLIIPRFSNKDEGNYVCDVSYRAGGSMETIHVTAYVRPTLTGWLEKDKGGQTFAVCKAQSKPAASIYWELLGNTPPPEINSSKSARGLYTVTSRLQLPENASLTSLTCVIPSSHNNQEKIQFNFSTKHNEFNFSVKWPFILLGVCATCVIVTLLTGLYFTREKMGQLRVFRKICCTPQIPKPPPREEKMPQPCDPEEVEPYASYVQRVNSIYNSSAELFNA